MDAFLKAVTGPLYRGSLPEWQAAPLRSLVTEGLARGATLPQIAYVLATAHHETGRFRYMEEIASGEAYEGRASLGNTEPGDGRRFKGRGFVQITGRRNYTELSGVVGVDLVEDPEAAKDPRIAATIIWHGMLHGTFTGKALADFISGDTVDFVHARWVVNGMDKADTIAGYAEQFLAALRVASLAPMRSPIPKGRPSPVKSKTVQASALQIASGVGTAASGAAMLDGTAQIVALAIGGLVILAAMFILRERLKAWAEGWT